MIDWWPWWITTAVALPLAAVALALFFFARRRNVRTALGVGAAVAVGLGVAAPFVMDSSGDSTSAMTAASDERLTAKEFARRADANCRKLARQPAANFGKPAPTPRFATRLDAFLPFMWRALRAQGELRPPGAEQETAAKWMNAMTAFGRDFQAMRSAARSRAADAFGAATKRLGAHAGEAGRLSKQLGLSYCFQ